MFCLHKKISEVWYIESFLEYYWVSFFNIFNMILGDLARFFGILLRSHQLFVIWDYKIENFIYFLDFYHWFKEVWLVNIWISIVRKVVALSIGGLWGLFLCFSLLQSNLSLLSSLLFASNWHTLKITLHYMNEYTTFAASCHFLPLICSWFHQQLL